jgi:hypothetical protein
MCMNGLSAGPTHGITQTVRCTKMLALAPNLDLLISPGSAEPGLLLFLSVPRALAVDGGLPGHLVDFADSELIGPVVTVAHHRAGPASV